MAFTILCASCALYIFIHLQEIDDFNEVKAPNGKRLEPCDRIVLFFANMLISAVGKEDALEFFRYIGGLENNIVVSVN